MDIHAERLERHANKRLAKRKVLREEKKREVTEFGKLMNPSAHRCQIRK